MQSPGPSRARFRSAHARDLRAAGGATEPLSAPAGCSPSPLPADVVRLVEQHVGLVRQVLLQVGRRLPTHVDRADLFGAGSEALLGAARRFDPGNGATFPAFAAKRVRGAMLDQVRRWDWIARSVRSGSHDVADAVEDLEARLGREPSTREVATALATSVERVRHTRLDCVQATVLSLEAVTAAGGHRLPATTATPLDIIATRETHTRLQIAVDTLPDRERHAVVGYYLDERPMRELARELGVSESRVSQLCRQGLKHLHENLAPYVLDDGVDRTPVHRRRAPHEPRTGT